MTSTQDVLFSAKEGRYSKRVALIFIEMFSEEKSSVELRKRLTFFF